MAGRLEFQLGIGAQRPSPGRTSPQGPMRLLLMGDFSRLPAADRPALANRPTHRLDLDSLDKVLGRLAPQVQLDFGAVRFKQMDDFHPDHLYGRLEGFKALQSAREHTTAKLGEDELGRLLGKSTDPGAKSSVSPSTAPTPATKTGLEALLQQLVAPHIVPDTRAQTQSHQSAVDSASTSQMRAVLHDPAFQALESHWRGVQWLISQLTLDDDSLQLHLLDISREEMVRDIVRVQGQVAQTALRQALDANLQKQAGGGRWSALLMLDSFGQDDADVGLLAALGVLASQLQAPMLAGANEALQDTQTPTSAAWQTLQRSEAAPWIGLAAPRVLLRLPYGKSQDPIESFPFEEMLPGTPEHEQFLWGSASLALALLLGQSFMASGWDMQAGDLRDITDLPAYTYEHNGERELQACAEHYLSDQTAADLLARGLMPLLSHRHRNAALLMRLQSIAEPACALAGPWC